MSPDPSGLYFADQTNPQSLNLYSYVLNNPLKLVDPTGLGWCYHGDPNDVGGSDDSDYDMNSPNAADCQGGQWHDVSASVTVNANDGSGTIDTVDSGLSSDGISETDYQHFTFPGRTCPTGPAKIYSFSATTSYPTQELGALIGGAIGNVPGALIGGAIGSMFGVGLTGSYVPSTHSVYLGVTATAAPFQIGGGAVSAEAYL